jgi:glycosyltransferase involved in cell wall biosynthesis
VRALDDPRKGFDLLAAAARRLAADGWGERAELVVFGAHGAPGIRNVGLRTTVLGRIGDDAVLARAYAAADVFVAPSREENLAQTVLEALSCGTPCVAFAVGGFPDAIVPGVCGWLARPFEVGDLASCIARVLGDDAARESLSRGARARAVAEFSLERCGRRYVALFEDLLSRPAGMRPSST